MRKSLLLLGLVVFLLNRIKAQQNADSQQPLADVMWKTKPGLIINFNDSFFDLEIPLPYKISSPTQDASSVSDEIFMLKKEYGEWNDIFRQSNYQYLREWGMMFWERFPSDSRRFDWLLETLIYSPLYIKNLQGIILANSYSQAYDTVEIDFEAKRRWERKYEHYRKEFLESSFISIHKKQELQRIEICNELFLWRKTTMTDKFDYKNWLQKLIQYLKIIERMNREKLDGLSGKTQLKPAKKLIDYWEAFGLDDNDVDDCLVILRRSNIKILQELAHDKENSMLKILQRVPLEFGTKSFDGKSVELKEFRGKLVLVDFWSIGCGSCIAAMPKWKEIYNKYKKYGFEIISACFMSGNWENGRPLFPNEKKRVLDVHQKIGAQWPLILLNKKFTRDNHRIWEIYRFEGFPTYMLFDENGRPLLCNGELKRNPEKIIKSYLTKSKKLREPATSLDR